MSGGSVRVQGSRFNLKILGKGSLARVLIARGPVTVALRELVATAGRSRPDGPGPFRVGGPPAARHSGCNWHCHCHCVCLPVTRIAAPPPSSSTRSRTRSHGQSPRRLGLGLSCMAIKLPVINCSIICFRFKFFATDARYIPQRLKFSDPPARHDTETTNGRLQCSAKLPSRCASQCKQRIEPAR